MMGMSSPEWSTYLRDEFGLDIEPDEISDAVVARLEQIYRERLPLLEGAVEAVERLAERWPLGLASSSNREIIDLFLELSGLAGRFEVTLSSEEVARGKPAPDVYLEVARRLRVEPAALRGRGGLDERHTRGAGGGHGGDRAAEPALPAGRRRARGRGRADRVARRADARARRAGPGPQAEPFDVTAEPPLVGRPRAPRRPRAEPGSPTITAQKLVAQRSA